jgi:hypothetical protein
MKSENHRNLIWFQHLAQLRLATHIVIGLFLGGVYYDIGNEASKVHSCTAFLMYAMMFIFFCNLFPFVHSCKYWLHVTLGNARNMVSTNITLLLGAFSKIRKMTIIVVTSARMEQLGSQRNDFHEIWCLNVFRKSAVKIHVLLKYDKNKGYVTRRTIDFFIILRPNLLRMINISD